MNVNFCDSILINLVKLNLRIYNIPKIIIFSLTFFSIIIYFIINRLNNFSFKYDFNINFWDGIFRVLNHSMLILGIYFLFIIMIIFLFNTNNKYGYIMMIRTNKKITLITSKIITNLIMSFIFTITFFICTFIISYIFFGFNYNWSVIILDSNSLRLVPELYVNNFVYELTPIKASFISFFEIYLCTAIIMNLRDILINYISKTYIANLIMIIYLFSNIICSGYNLNKGIFILSNYIGLDSMALIFRHKFKNFGYFNITILQSLCISLLFLIIIICINIVLNRKLVLSHD